jgi:hypothetical protein
MRTAVPFLAKGGYPNGLNGVPSRKGFLRTIAAVHNQRIPAVVASLDRHIVSRKPPAADALKIKYLLPAGARDDPNLERSPA